MIEQELPHGNIEIPKHWNFPEKNNPGLRVEQLDIENSFVAVSWPTILGKDEEGNLIIYSRNAEGTDFLFPDPSEYADYIVRPDGTPLSFRHHSFKDTLVVLSRGDMRVAYKIED